MITIKSIDQKSRQGIGPLLLKIAGLFAVALIAGFIGLFAIRSVSSIAERRAMELPTAGQADQIVIDPKMESDLSNALTFQAINEPDLVLDPFSDRAGLSQTAASRTALAVEQTPGANAGTPSTSAGTAGSAASNNAAGSAPGQVIDIASTEATRARFEKWRNADAAPERADISTILAIDDLVPVGFASGGNGGAEVMLFSQALCDVFSFPVGTKFLNGSLTSFDQAEVVFLIGRTSRHRSYRRPEPCRGPDGTDRKDNQITADAR